MPTPRTFDDPGRVLLSDSVIVLHVRLAMAVIGRSFDPFPPDGMVEGDSGSPKPQYRIRRGNPTDTGFSGFEDLLHGLRYAARFLEKDAFDDAVLLLVSGKAVGRDGRLVTK